MGKKRAKRSLTFFCSDHISGFFLPYFIGGVQNWAKRSLGKKRAKKSVSTERHIMLASLNIVASSSGVPDLISTS